MSTMSTLAASIVSPASRRFARDCREEYTSHDHHAARAATA
jgi:hypothetical protein